MEAERIFMTISGLWGVGTIAVLIYAIRLCYRIERRSGWRKPGSLPTYAAWLPVILNRGVAKDEETQRLRRRMNLLFLLVAAGLGAFALFVGFMAPRDGAL